MYMVFVAGATHKTLAEAREEAVRLAKLYENIGVQVLVLKVVAKCMVSTLSEWKEVR